MNAEPKMLEAGPPEKKKRAAKPKATQIVRGWVQLPVLVTVDTRGRGKIVDVYAFYDYAHIKQDALGGMIPHLEACFEEPNPDDDVRYYGEDDVKVEQASARVWERIALDAEKLNEWL